MSIAANNAIESSLFIICLLRKYRANRLGAPPISACGASGNDRLTEASRHGCLRSEAVCSDLFDRPIVGQEQTRQFALHLHSYQRFFWSLRKTSLTSWSRSLSRSERLSSNSLAPEARRRSRNAPSLDFLISRRPSSKSISTAAPPSSNRTTSPYAMPEPKAYETSSPTP